MNTIQEGGVDHWLNYTVVSARMNNITELTLPVEDLNLVNDRITVLTVAVDTLMEENALLRKLLEPIAVNHKALEEPDAES